MIRSERKQKLTRNDWIAMLVITIIYGVIALYNLGGTEVPQTYYNCGESGTTVNLDFSNKEANITSIHYYPGRKEERVFYLMESWDNVNWTVAAVNGQDPASFESSVEAGKFTLSGVFSWGETTCNVSAPYIQLFCSTEDNILNEIVFMDANGNKVRPVNADSYVNMFDEQDLMPEISTFRDSTYFDEIYHARTAYEMVEGVYCYENTHPPLGKFIISLGIRLYGMCPFGWRIMGTLFGIAMLPIFYLFTKKMFQKTWFATITTVLFASDFMHFAQTRIATIDVYVTFFVILMYYFMYQYTRLSFYDTEVKETWKPLFWCGIAMGLGCACKWPGVYAGIGLAVIFFATMLQRYLEFRKAKKEPEGQTDGIKHELVIQSFKKNLIKTLSFCILAFVVIPGTIYTLSYLPFDDGNEVGLISFVTDTQPAEDGIHTISTVPLKDGETLSLDTTYTKVAIKRELKNTESFMGKMAVKWNSAGINRLLGRMVRNQETMFSYHSKLDAEHTFSSWFYEWPIMKRPIWYYVKVISGDVQENISAFGNPLVWWAGIPAFIYMVVLAFWKKDRKAAFLCVGYLAQYLPWFNVSRITFIYHYFPSVPFITIMIGYSMYRLCMYKNGKFEKRFKKICIGYAVVSIALFAIYYPVLSGYPVDITYVKKYLRLFKSWVLVWTP